MVAGVILFTVANATIISIAADLDESGEYKEKVEALIITSRGARVKPSTLLRVHQSLYYDEKHNYYNMTRLIGSLPL